MIQRFLVPTLAIVLSLLPISCGNELETEKAPPPVTRDLDQILEGGTLNALVTYNSTGYFIYRGEPMGYEYELLKAFAKDHDLELNVTVIRDRDELWPELNKGNADVAAARLLETVVDEKVVAFTDPLYQTRPALIQRNGPPSTIPLPEQIDDALEIPESSDSVEVDAKLIQKPAELGGTTVHVVHQSPYRERLLELEEQITGDIEIVEVEDIASVEPLIRRVAKGEIRLTVSPRNVAELNDEYFTNLEDRPRNRPSAARRLGCPAECSRAARRN